MPLPGIEPRTFRLPVRRANHYTKEDYIIMEQGGGYIMILIATSDSSINPMAFNYTLDYQIQPPCYKCSYIRHFTNEVKKN